ncbi:MAG: DoxX family protein [Fimbriimonadaceae bacterium]
MRGKDVDFGLLVLRLAVGGIVIYYGAQKMLGLFAGLGFAPTIQMFQKMGFPPVFGALSIFAEFFGSLGLITGTLTRVAAVGLTANMAVATWVMLKQPDIFSNIFKFGDAADARTVAYPMLLCLASLAILLTGAGRFSVDAKLFGKAKPKKG